MGCFDFAVQKTIILGVFTSIQNIRPHVCSNCHQIEDCLANVSVTKQPAKGILLSKKYIVTSISLYQMADLASVCISWLRKRFSSFFQFSTFTKNEFFPPKCMLASAALVYSSHCIPEFHEECPCQLTSTNIACAENDTGASFNSAPSCSCILHAPFVLLLFVKRYLRLLSKALGLPATFSIYHFTRLLTHALVTCVCRSLFSEPSCAH